MTLRKFDVSISQNSIDDLHSRLSSIRWSNDYGNIDGRYGVKSSWLQSVVEYWNSEYDWVITQNKINSYPQFCVEIDELVVHFVHVRSDRTNSMPIILTHGWPWSFWDWKDVLDELMGTDDPPFDIIIPSLPGFGFSSPLLKSGIGVREIAKVWHVLMRDILGYRKFAVAGGDWGSLVSAELAHAYPESILGVHLTLPLLPGISVADLSDACFSSDEQ